MSRAASTSWCRTVWPEFRAYPPGRYNGVVAPRTESLSKAAIIANHDQDRRWEGPCFLRYWHLASLDAPTVAVVWSLAFAWSVGVPLPMWAPAILALMTWAIYVGDRLLDAWAGMKDPPLHHVRDRHIFHWRHRSILVPAALAASALAAALVIQTVPAGTRVSDSAVAAATLAYFSGVHSRGKFLRWLTSILSRLSARATSIGLLFTAGCLLPAISQSSPASFLSIEQGTAFMYFAAVAWLNCYAIGRWESIPTARSGRQVTFRAVLLGAIGTLLAVSLAAAPRLACLVAASAASAFCFVLLERMRTRLSPVVLRAGADLVLLTPSLLLLAPR